MSIRTEILPDGDVPIPKDVRDRLAWSPGTALEIVEQGNSVTLRRISRGAEFARKTLADLDALPGAGPAQATEAISRLASDDIRRLTQ